MAAFLVEYVAVAAAADCVATVALQPEPVEAAAFDVRDTLAPASAPTSRPAGSAASAWPGPAGAAPRSASAARAWGAVVPITTASALTAYSRTATSSSPMSTTLILGSYSAATGGLVGSSPYWPSTLIRHAE